MDKRLKNIIIAIIILLLIALNIAVFIKYNKEENVVEENTIIEEVLPEKEEGSTLDEIDATVRSKVTEMGERERIETYFGSYINAIQTKNYSKAYVMLNENFKNNYFKEEIDFENYIKQKYPTSNIIVKYNNIERQGEVFIITVTLDDAFDPNFEPIEQRVVIRENSANSFKISFQVE